MARPRSREAHYVPESVDVRYSTMTTRMSVKFTTREGTEVTLYLPKRIESELRAALNVPWFKGGELEDGEAAFQG